MSLVEFLGDWMRSIVDEVEVRRTRLHTYSARRNHFPAIELLEDCTLLSSTNAVTADSFTLVDSGTSGQLSVMQSTDWDAQAVPEWVAMFAGQRITQTAGMNQTFVTDDYVAVDVNKTYGLSGWARSGDNFGMRFSSLNQQSFGIEEYDANYTYTRNVAAGGATGLWSASGINVATKTITLNAPWSGPLISAGTAVRNATSGSDHSTIALNRGGVAGDFSPTEQVAAIGGGTSANGAYAAGRFSPGTTFV